VVFNPHSFEGDGIVKVDGKSVLVRGIAPKGYGVAKEFIDTNNVKIDGKVVETDVLRVVFNDAWQMTSIYDKKNNREVLKAGEVGNQLRVYADYPDIYDAWEWQPYSRDSYRVIDGVSSVEIVNDGVRRGIRIVRPHMKSTVTQTVWFADGTARIDFETVADWHERHQMLKCVFPVDINADKATYEIQFGTVERPTHSNTSWDQARFEVCAHKYADVSEGGFGVSLLNDCKYGHDIHDGIMQLSLLRSPTYPNPEADQGEHVFTYSLYPHAGTLAESDTVKQAYYLNDPMVAVATVGERDEIPTSFSAVTLDTDHVICETIKESEEGSDTILRMYECKNRRGTVKVKLGIPASRVYLCDLMENPIREIPVADGYFEHKILGFEIATFKIV
jgi:alpha-mannosidase